MLRRGILKVLCGLSVCLLFVSCSGSSHESTSDSGKEQNDPKTEVEYQRIATELKLAEADEPYLVLDFEHKRLFIKLKGAVVWDCALNLTESDSGKVKRLLASYKQKGQFDLQPISTKYLYTFQPRIPDSLLTIVTDALNVESSLLQRELPARFYLKWNNGLSLEIQTDIEGRQKSFLKNIVFNFQLALQRFFGQKLMTLKMSTTDALTLYRVVRPCMPTLLIY